MVFFGYNFKVKGWITSQGYGMDFTEQDYKIGELPEDIKHKILNNIKVTEWSIIDKLYFSPNTINDNTVITIAKKDDYHGYAIIGNQIIVASLEPVEIWKIETLYRDKR
jgi:hypothetical protein